MASSHRNPGRLSHSRRHAPSNDEDEAMSSRDLAALDEQFPPTTSPSRAHPRRHHTDPAASQSFDRQYELQPIPAPSPLPSGSGNMSSGKSHPDKASFTQSFNAETRESVGVRNSVRAYIRNKRAERQGNRLKVTWQQRLRDNLGAKYETYIIQGLLRRRPLPPSQDGRHIPLGPSRDPASLVDERRKSPYISNFIRSNRYTVYDFIPKQLIYQFSKLGNFYFLFMGILQLVPGLSTVGRWTTIAPLGVFVAFSMAKEGWDDYRRYKLDRIENRSETWILSNRVQSGRIRHAEKIRRRKEKKGENGEEHILDDFENGHVVGSNEDWSPVQWEHVKVGDVIRLRRDEAVPADIVLLHATGLNGIAYIDTMALDGETNLKSKQACTLLAERCNTLEGLRSTEATVVSEDPNLDLYSYDGRATVDGETLPLTLNNVVYRGSTLRNTTEAIGLVINSGEECKIRMNANKNIRAKTPAMQSTINWMVLVQIFIVLMLTMGLTIGYHLWKHTEHQSWYLNFRGVGYSNIRIFTGYLIMFNTLIPLSLYISLEIIKLGQLVLLQDAEMYDPVSDTPMVANTTTILENLGQVSYIFSDKTGTLTENMMRFRKMTVAGLACLHDMDVHRDEAERQRKIEASERPKRSKKGKNREQTERNAPKPLEHDYFDDVATTVDETNRPNPLRTSSTLSASKWRSSVRPNELPDMKTEELLEYIHRKPNTAFSRKAKHFLLCIALCHTCLPETTEDGKIEFQAASPDELALVEAARDLGYLLIDRPAQAIKIQTQDADGTLQTETYQVLDVIEFSSKRKRMSIIIRMPDGRICLFCKGADNIVTSRLRLHNLAQQKAQDIGRRMSLRRTQEQDRASRRLSAQASSAHNSPRNSIALTRGPSQNGLQSLRLSIGRRSTELNRLSQQFVTSPRSPRSSMDMLSPTSPTSPMSPLQSMGRMESFDEFDRRIDESVASSDGAVFEKCFQHIDDFATEGLRTLLYGYRYLDEDSYAQWKQIYREAETSLIDRQQRIEEAGDIIEQKLELAGATAIEDKLQEGVPDTIDKLRRANMKIWMLTGDKRETAVNIGHSARVCKPYSEIYVLDATLDNLQNSLTDALNDVSRQMVPHSVVVVDGLTLAVIDGDENLAELFYDLVIRVDSVICCRASPSQKANLVRAIRRYVPKRMTLAVGDGANDIGMIQASHVGIGISGREGLQASRISDFSIAQFRFLQKLLLVHGRWNYMRTGKYVLATFWKEMLFFLVQAHYQRFNGYTGTSLYESWCLTVFNSAFTSLPVILLGIFEKDLRADTLLAVPELYSFGQQGRGFRFPQYFGWMFMGVAGSFIIYYFTWLVYRDALYTDDNSLFAMGSAAFTVSVLFINIKLLVLELHSKTIITFGGLLVSVAGWFLWMLALSGIYSKSVGPYIVRDAFIDNFGRKLQWWTTCLLELVALVVMDLVVQAVRRVYFPTDQDLMQRIEKDADIKSIFRDNAHAENGPEDGAEVESVGDERPLAVHGEDTRRQSRRFDPLREEW